MNALPHTRLRVIRKYKGFTLVELVVAITISMIVAGFIFIFISTPIDAYFAQSRRAELIVESNLITRNIDNDVRNAVPNSIRAAQIGSVFTLEMLEADDMTTYRFDDPITPPPPPSQPDEKLDVGIADSKFSTLGKFNNIQKPFSKTDHYLIVDHENVAGHNAYAFDPVITPALTQIAISDEAPGIDHVVLGSAFIFATPISTSHHIFLVSSPITYVCDGNAHTLTRYSGYSIAPGIAANHNSALNIGVLSRDVGTCNSINIAGVTALYNQLVSMNLQLLRSGEFMQVFTQTAIESLP